jgi:hypothetical protein
MDRRTMVALVLAGLLALPPAALAQGSDWVGTWVGTIGGGWKGKSGPRRTMAIESIAADGSARGGWSANQRPRIGNAEFKLDGERLTVQTDDSLVTISRVDARTLRGTLRYIETGKTFPIEFDRQ